MGRPVSLHSSSARFTKLSLVFNPSSWFDREERLGKISSDLKEACCPSPPFFARTVQIQMKPRALANPFEQKSRSLKEMRVSAQLSLNPDGLIFSSGFDHTIKDRRWRILPQSLSMRCVDIDWGRKLLALSKWNTLPRLFSVESLIP